MDRDAPELAYDELQALVDRSANHHFFTFPEAAAIEVSMLNVLRILDPEERFRA